MKCPNCGNKLTLMVIEDVTKFERPVTENIALELLFNCEKCTHDWRTTVVLPDNLTLYPKFWG